MYNILQSFHEALHEHGLVPEEIIADGNLHRCPTEGKPRKQNGAYIATLDKPATIWWCNWETGDQGTYLQSRAGLWAMRQSLLRLS